MGGVCISALTLLFAYKIYKNFDVKKSFLKEQLKTVCDLSNELYNFGLPTYYMGAGSASSHHRFFNFFNQQGIEKYQEIYFTTMSIDKILPFTNYQHNILLPKPIAEVIKKFDRNMYKSTKKDTLPQNYILILHPQKTEKEYINYYYYMSYDTFYNLSSELVTEISKWLERYGAIDINLPRLEQK